MLDTKKLLYILPDVAYIAEGIPEKKPYSFSIHSFTQVNGSFLTEDEFLAENIQKLFGKLEAGENYHIILPDFLFTSTIVSIAEKSDAAIKEYLQTATFPQMGITRDTHLIDSAVLNQIRGTSRVQLSAIEKELLAPLRVAAQDHESSIAGISPLGWAIKSLISLEPSISVLQMGGHLYACEHYIGIDQTSYAPIDDISSIAETIRTLKGSEPSIQTVYLLSNPLIEEKLKEALQKTLPIQQMAGNSDTEERMPASVKEVLEFSFKTLAISDYPVPIFALAKPSAEELAAFGAAALTQATTQPALEDLDELPLPKPAQPEAPTPATTTCEDFVIADAAELEKEAEELAKIEAESSEESETAQDSGAESEVQEGVVLHTTTHSEATLPSATPPSVSPPKLAQTAVEQSASTDTQDLPSKASSANTTTPTENSDIDLTQFVGAQSKQEQAAATSAPATNTQVQSTQPLPTIKNKSGIQNMLKMIFITLAVFCVTVAVGAGVGLAVLKYSGADSAQQEPVVAVVTTPTPEPTATPEPTPTASASATKAPTNLKILVVNATTKAGYAGTFKTKIEQSKLGKVTAANAKGKYESGYLVYMKKEDPAAIATLEEATGLKTTVDETAKDEDPQGTYDLVLILAE
jgi:hypothetical protein